MARIVLAWELGGGYGHVAKLVPLAERLRAAGHNVGLVLRQPQRARLAARGAPLPAVVAPHWKGRNPPGASAIDYSGVLALSGYTEAATVRTLVSAWRRIFDSAKPDLLVVNHAPTALLAARAAGFPRVVLGTGFEVPPRSRPFASLQPWRNVSKTSRARLDERVRDIINKAVRGSGAPPLDHPADLFDVEATFLCTFPEVDHYGMRRKGDYVGPVAQTIGTETPSWPRADGPRVLVYLTGTAEAKLGIVEQLRRLGWPALVHLRDASPGIALRTDTGTLQITSAPLNLSGLGGRCDLVICHGGHGTTTDALRAGIPVLAFPQHLEQATLAHRVGRLGAGVAVGKHEGPVDLAALVSRLVGADSEPTAAASAFAAAHADFDPRESLEKIAAHCLTLID